MLGRIWGDTRGRVAVVATVLVLVAGGAGAWWWLRDGTQATAGTYRMERSTAIYAPIANRKADPRPLTEQEILGPDTERLTANDTVLVRRAASLSEDCAAVVWGSAAEALTGCTQVLRAVYASEDGAVSGQFLVFNMPDAAAADALVAALDPKADRGFVRVAPEQPASFDAARSWAQARALGHFVTLSWVGPVGDERPDLTGPQLALDGLGQALNQRVVDAE
ncbi:hypothetical protein GCM10010106_06970 [Thermopolyspora flexuosa]|uniref:Uncharacterized protein n=1 Tax=Thermopolyspora flexuosa TaxID=103836 RepID=A0A543IZI8_9ACTN|nr:hypothetical protein [Thermopolyspora flexuosa]TQM75971.1 hypothetical protein FHX40_2695 [Thermopolyspora flexuosa]GGM63608.1 hypothetical protein GCM10010106_06970 [Thermopolyspora flexuosa]